MKITGDIAYNIGEFIQENFSKDLEITICDPNDPLSPDFVRFKCRVVRDCVTVNYPGDNNMISGLNSEVQFVQSRGHREPSIEIELMEIKNMSDHIHWDMAHDKDRSTVMFHQGNLGYQTGPPIERDTQGNFDIERQIIEDVRRHPDTAIHGSITIVDKVKKSKNSKG